MDLQRTIETCKTWNSQPNKPFHIVCKGGAHLSYKLGLPLNDIDLTIYTNRFETIPIEYVRMLCDALLPRYELTGSDRLYHVSVGEQILMDIVVINEEYLTVENNDASFVYYACRNQGKTVHTFFESLYEQNKLFPDMSFELLQCIAGYELYDRVVKQIHMGMRPNEVSKLPLFERKRDTYAEKQHVIRKLLSDIELGLDDHDDSDELKGGKRKTKCKKCKNKKSKRFSKVKPFMKNNL